VLIVRNEPPHAGWVVMLEQDGQRTRCAQLADTEGEALMAAVQDVVIDHLVQRTGIHPTLATTRSRA
jgi:hypothetical protein